MPRARSVKSIALINPLPDFGVDTYAYELAQGIAGSGVRVDAFCHIRSRLGDLELGQNHRRFNVLGRRLPRDLANARTISLGPASPAPSASSASSASGAGPASTADATSESWRHSVRRAYLSAELLLRLKQGGYDAVWTQWPEMDDYAGFWEAFKWLRVPLVHTVHNILPHGGRPGDIAAHARVYGASRLLFVHSNEVARELATLYPADADKAFVVPLGAYTSYPRRPETRAATRASLGIPERAVVLLISGAILPYKNIDATVLAFAALRRDDVVLVISGAERDGASDFPIEAASGRDPLARTRAFVRDAGVEKSVRFVPGLMSSADMAELFEASDVLLLPYTKSYGSGMLMLGIAFGKYVVATRTGMEEAASRYSRSILLDGSDASAIQRGLEIGIARAIADPSVLDAVPPEFKWTNIAATSIEAIGRAIGK
jgi:glycosyltransferase involved in cell wall biosynthesis